MKIGVVGAGYVGLVTATGLASRGHDVVCVDVQSERVASINAAQAPLFEPGLDAMLGESVRQSRLSASTDYASLHDCTVVFICVGTPSRPDGSMEEGQLHRALSRLADVFRNKPDRFFLVMKSTVLPGTTRRLMDDFQKRCGKKGGTDFGICVNPEFLREGRAVHDFQHPDRIILGCSDTDSSAFMQELYAGFDCPFFCTTPETAEMIKYASNAFLATKISFINEIGNLCKSQRIDVYDVASGMGLDSRISPHFLNAGAGFGGSCFPKDVRALMVHAQKSGCDLKLLDAVMAVNERQPLRLLDLVVQPLGGQRVAVLGLAFKPGTDDVRESPAIALVKALEDAGAQVTAYDPKAVANFKSFAPNVRYASSAREAIAGSDSVFIVTDWDEFKDPMLYAGKRVYDGRRVIRPSSEYEYHGLCW